MRSPPTPHSLATALGAVVVASALFGCPAETVPLLHSSADGPPLALATHAAERFEVRLETPGDAYPGEGGYRETLRFFATLRADRGVDDEPEVTLLVANRADQEGDERRGMASREQIFVSDTDVTIELTLYDCGEGTCRRTFDVDFLGGDARVQGEWRVDHTIDWTSEDQDPPARARTTLDITSVR